MPLPSNRPFTYSYSIVYLHVTDPKHYKFSTPAMTGVYGCVPLSSLLWTLSAPAYLNFFSPCKSAAPLLLHLRHRHEVRPLPLPPNPLCSLLRAIKTDSPPLPHLSSSPQPKVQLPNGAPERIHPPSGLPSASLEASGEPQVHPNQAREQAADLGVVGVPQEASACPCFSFLLLYVIKAALTLLLSMIALQNYTADLIQSFTWFVLSFLQFSSSAAPHSPTTYPPPLTSSLPPFPRHLVLIVTGVCAPVSPPLSPTTTVSGSSSSSSSGARAISPSAGQSVSPSSPSYLRTDAVFPPLSDLIPLWLSMSSQTRTTGTDTPRLCLTRSSLSSTERTLRNFCFSPPRLHHLRSSPFVVLLCPFVVLQTLQRCRSEGYRWYACAAFDRDRTGEKRRDESQSDKEGRRDVIGREAEAKGRRETTWRGQK